MQRIEIFLDEAVREKGYSTTTVYSDDDVIVSIGSTNALWQGPSVPIITFEYGISGIRLLATEDLLEKWKITKNDRKNDFCWSILMSSLSKQNFQSILRNHYEQGVDDGRQSLQCQIRSLLAC